MYTHLKHVYISTLNMYFYIITHLKQIGCFALLTLVQKDKHIYKHAHIHFLEKISGHTPGLKTERSLHISQKLCKTTTQA